MLRWYYTLLLFICLYSHGQDFVQKATPVSKFLFNYKGDIGLIQKRSVYCFPVPNFPFLQNDKIKFEPKYIKNNTGLYVIQDGNGIVYKAINLLNDSIYYKRIDSTLYYGYNCQSIRFSFKDTLFSFGGYGFYRMHGQLLYFTLGKDWDIIALNEETPVVDLLHFFDNKNGLLYYLTAPYTNESINRVVKDFSFYQLDLNRALIKKLGKPNLIFEKINLSDIKVNCPSLGGTLFQSGNEIHLLKFDENAIYTLREGVVKRKLQQRAINFCGNIFETDGLLCFTFEPNGPLNFVKLRLKDFEKSNQKIFLLNENYFMLEICIIIILIIIFISISFYFFRLRKKNREQIEIQNHPLFTIDSKNNSQKEKHFTVIEQQFVEKLFTICQTNEKVNVEEIHLILGLKNKSTEVQKKYRTEIINRINYKFRAISYKDDDLVLRERSVDDKRYFLYYIKVDSFKIFQSIV